MQSDDDDSPLADLERQPSSSDSRDGEDDVEYSRRAPAVPQCAPPALSAPAHATPAPPPTPHRAAATPRTPTAAGASATSTATASDVDARPDDRRRVRIAEYESDSTEEQDEEDFGPRPDGFSSIVESVSLGRQRKRVKNDYMSQTDFGNAKTRAQLERSSTAGRKYIEFIAQEAEQAFEAGPGLTATLLDQLPPDVQGVPLRQLASDIRAATLSLIIHHHAIKATAGDDLNACFGSVICVLSQHMFLLKNAAGRILKESVGIPGSSELASAVAALRDGGGDDAAAIESFQQIRLRQTTDEAQRSPLHSRGRHFGGLGRGKRLVNPRDLGSSFPRGRPAHRDSDAYERSRSPSRSTSATRYRSDGRSRVVEVPERNSQPDSARTTRGRGRGRGRGRWSFRD